MDELLDDPVKNYLKQIGQIPLLSAEQEVDLSKRIHAGAEAAHILQADRQKYGAPEYIKKNSARFSFEEDENSRSYTEDLDEDGNTKSSEDDEEKAAEEEAMEAVENGPLSGGAPPGAAQDPPRRPERPPQPERRPTCVCGLHRQEACRPQPGVPGSDPGRATSV